MLWEICTIFCSTHVRPGDPLAECSNIKFEITSNESHITEARQYCRAQSYSRPVTGDRIVYDKGDKLSIDRRSLNSNHHLVEFFPTFSGRAPRIVSHTDREPMLLSYSGCQSVDSPRHNLTTTTPPPKINQIAIVLLAIPT